MRRTISAVISFLFLTLLPDVPFYAQTPTVQKQGVTNTEWKQLPAGILIWGILPNGTGIQVDLYDQQLKTTASVTKTTAGFTVNEVTLYYVGSSYCEFLLHNAAKKEQVFIRYNYQLKELYASPKFLAAVKMPNDTVFALTPKRREESIAYLRNDSLLWEIRKDTVTVSKGKKVVKSFLWISKEQKTDKFPVFKKERRYEIDARIPEYAKVFLSESNRLYFYMNYSFAQREQFVYCVTPADARLVYKTKLAPDDSTGCIFSNYYFDKTNQQLLISGTNYQVVKTVYNLRDTTHIQTGTLVATLNNKGIITARLNNTTYNLTYPSTIKHGSSQVAFGRNGTTYSRFVAMGPDSKGYMSAIVESYALLYMNGTSRTDAITTDLLIDRFFHFFLLQKNDYKYGARKLEHFDARETTLSRTFNAGTRFSGVANYTTVGSRFNVNKYNNDINRLCDPATGDSYYVGRAWNDSLKQDRVLMKNTVLTKTDTTEIYFYKNVGNGTLIHFQDIMAVPGQDMLVKCLYFVRDKNTLFKFTPRKDSYLLEITKW